jgi:hypothetical protein
LFRKRLRFRSSHIAGCSGASTLVLIPRLRWFAVSVRKPPHSVSLSIPPWQQLVDPIDRDQRCGASYGNANYERLVEIKAKYDPSNMFRLNQNIRPSSD